GRGGDNVAVFIVAAICRDFTNVNFGVEVSGKGVAVVATVHIDNIQLVDVIEVVLCKISRKHIRGTWIEATAKQGGEAGLFKFILVCPLPAVLKLCGIEGLVVGGIHVVHTRLQARIHDGEILVGQSHVDHEFWRFGCRSVEHTS